MESPDELVEAYGQEAVDEAARNIVVMEFLIQNAKIVEPEPTEAESSSESGEEEAPSESEEETTAGN